MWVPARTEATAALVEGSLGPRTPRAVDGKPRAHERVAAHLDEHGVGPAGGAAPDLSATNVEVEVVGMSAVEAAIEHIAEVAPAHGVQGQVATADQ